MAVKYTDTPDGTTDNLADITICDLGIVATHNMPCAIHTHNEPAVMDCGRGVFNPSWVAQEEGWRLHQLRKGRFRRWLYMKVAPYIFEPMRVRG